MMRLRETGDGDSDGRENDDVRKENYGKHEKDMNKTCDKKGNSVLHVNNDKPKKCDEISTV